MTIDGPFFRWLDGVWGRRALRAPEGYPCEFTLGWLGYLGYELKRETGGNDVAAPTPDACLIFAGRAVVLDHAEGTAWLLALDAPDAGDWLRPPARPSPPRCPVRRRFGAGCRAGRTRRDRTPAPGSPASRAAAPHFTARDAEAVYKAKVAEAQREIAEGNTYEVCLTTALTATAPRAPAALDPWQTYLQLRRRNPAPFASYLRFGEPGRGEHVARAFPADCVPTAGCGPNRSRAPAAGMPDPGADTALRQELESSAKDRAENIMIVDLLRNDLSHFAVPGSVAVSRLCAIESYATVHQMVSTIDARLRPGMPRAEAVAACFPAGSMTGAPKVSTMAILDRLEAAPRGVYSGAIGYFSLNGAADLAVAIRTLVINGPR